MYKILQLSETPIGSSVKSWRLADKIYGVCLFWQLPPLIKKSNNENSKDFPDFSPLPTGMNPQQVDRQKTQVMINGNNKVINWSNINITPTSMVKLFLLHIYAQNGVWFDVLNA